MAKKKNTKDKEKILLKPFYLYTDLAESIKEQYSEYKKTGIYSPLVYFFTYWEDKDLNMSMFYLSEDTFKNDKDINKLFNVIFNIPIEDIIKKWHIDLPSSSATDVRFTAFLSFIDSVSENGLKTNEMEAIHKAFNDFRTTNLKEIANKQTFQEVNELITELFRDIYDQSKFKVNVFTGTSKKKIADAIRYLMIAKESEGGISFRQQSSWLYKTKKDWSNIVSGFGALLGSIKTISLIPDISKKNKLDEIKTTVKEAKKQLSGGILRKGLETKLEDYSKEAFETLQIDFLDKLTSDKIKKTLEGTEFSGLDDVQIKFIRTFYYTLVESHLLDILDYLIYAGILKSTFNVLNKGPLHPVAKNKVVLSKLKIKKKKKSSSKKSGLKTSKRKSKQTSSVKKQKQKSKSKKTGDTHPCPLCGADVPNNESKCPACGEPVIQCPDCGTYIEESEKKCPNCGQTFSDEIIFECPNCNSELVGDLDECPVCGAEFES